MEKFKSAVVTNMECLSSDVLPWLYRTGIFARLSATVEGHYHKATLS